MKWWQYPLFPFSIIYDLVTRMRNYLFDRRILPVFRFVTNVIAVGNLAVGGTGKTPMTACLINHYRNAGYYVSTLSRGHGRRTHGFRLADEGDSADTLGDESMMLHRRFAGQVGVAVGVEREFAIPELLYHRPETNLIILDDAFQYRAVQPSAHVLLTTFQQPFYSDWVLPAGRLRESRRGAARADLIVVTKCPDHLSEAQMVAIKEKIGYYSQAPVFFTAISYGSPQPFFSDQAPFHSQVVGISGIANAALFEQYLRSNFSPRLLHRYPDHHRYRQQDIKDILSELDGQTTLLTTEKDMIKLREAAEFAHYSCFYLPISIRFLKDESLFFSLIDQRLKIYAKTTD